MMPIWFNTSGTIKQTVSQGDLGVPVYESKGQHLFKGYPVGTYRTIPAKVKALGPDHIACTVIYSSYKADAFFTPHPNLNCQ